MPISNEERGKFYMQRNVKLSPALVALTWDVFFIWTISTLFFTQVKGLTNSQVIMLDSILMVFGCLFCVPVAKIFQNVKALTATRIGLLGYIVYLLIVTFGESYAVMILAQPFLAFGYATLSVKINTILTGSLHTIKRDKDYQRVYGKGMAIYYIIECIGAIGITYVYDWNPTAALMCSVAVAIVALLLTFGFKEPSKFMQQNISIDGKVEQPKQEKKPDSFIKLLKSAFFVSLLVYMFLCRGILSIASSSYKVYLNALINIDVIPMWIYGYLYAGTRLTAALFSKNQFKFNIKYGVRTLLMIVFSIITTFVITGVTYLIAPTSIISLVIITLASYVMGSLRTPNQIFINNYIQVCTPKRNHERAYSIRTMMEYLGYAAISAVYAGLLAVFNDNYGLTNLVYISIFAIPLIISMVVFIRLLVKKHAQKYTVIKDEYTKD